MKQIKSLLVISLICLLGSCAAPKDVAYFQNAEVIRGMSLQKEQPLRLRPKDKINILVNSADPMLVSQFNLTAATGSMRSLGSTTTPKTTAGGTSTIALPNYWHIRLMNKVISISRFWARSPLEAKRDKRWPSIFVFV